MPSHLEMMEPQAGRLLLVMSQRLAHEHAASASCLGKLGKLGKAGMSVIMHLHLSCKLWCY